MHKFCTILIIKPLLFLIKIYQKISRHTTPTCRYYPTCSEYSKTALKWHGLAGIKLSMQRISRCHPLVKPKVDFVPLPMKHFSYQQCDTLPYKNNALHDVPLCKPHLFVQKDTKSYRHMLNFWLKKY